MAVLLLVRYGIHIIMFFLRKERKVNRLEDIKKYEYRLRKIAEQIVNVADELGMSVHIDSTYIYGSVSTIVSLFDNSDTWYDCKNIATNNKELKCDAVWETNKKGEQK
jgi:hypothetical protein